MKHYILQMEMAILMHNGVFPSETSLVCSPEGFLLSLSRSVIFLFLGGPETDNIKIILLLLGAPKQINQYNIFLSLGGPKTDQIIQYSRLWGDLKTIKLYNMYMSVPGGPETDNNTT